MLTQLIIVLFYAFLPLTLVLGSDTTPSPILLISDYGILDENVSVVKGVMLSYQPKLNIVDITHQVPAFSITDAARILSNTTHFYPEGTVFLALIENSKIKNPKKLVFQTKRNQYFVVPDNGVISIVAEKDGIQDIREIKAGPWLNETALNTVFPGRDIYATVAAHIANKEDWANVGPQIKTITKIQLPLVELNKKGIQAEVISIDRVFGNILTNVTTVSLLNANYTLGDKVPVKIGGIEYQIPFVKTFSDVPVNESLLYVDSTNHATLAVNQGNFSKKYKVKVQSKIYIPRKTGK